ncbi:MAG: lamin tail domain-containing protein [Flavobacteriales bacterium]|nr:lamin tail domain-containing protein [Flavobacteriales bacterium]
MAVLLTAASASFAQVNYTRSTFTGTYVPITSGGGASTAGATGDGVLTTGLPIGFNFDYNGTVYTTFGVSTDGYLSFTATSNSLTNTNLYSTTAPNAVIAPWWDDLNTNAVGTNPAGSILYQTTGTTGNQVLTVQWIVSSYWSTTNGQPRLLNMQVKLYEATGNIELWYGDAIGSVTNTTESASIGLESATGGNGQYIDAITGSRFTSNGTNQSDRWPAVNFRFQPGSDAPLAGGTYNVGIGQTFETLSEAVAQLNLRGVNGPVTLNLTDALYDPTPAGGSNFFPIMLGPVSGASAVNTITITKSGAPAVISWGGSVGGSGTLGNQASTTAMTGSNVDPIIGLVGADYVTIENVDLQGNTGNALSDHGIGIYNSSATDGATNNVIQNVSVSMNRGNTGSRGFRMNTSTTATSAAGANSNNTFRDFTITSVYSGIEISGTAGFPDVNTQIVATSCASPNTIGDPNTVNDIGASSATANYGIQLTNQNSFTIADNVIRNVGNTTGTLDGINISLCSGTSTIANNVIRGIKGTGSTTTSVSGIRATHSTTTGLTGTVLRIYNNSISDITRAYTGTASTTRGLVGIRLNSTSTTNPPSYEVWNNSVSLDGSASPNLSNACFETTNPIGGAAIVASNNIFANFTVAQSGTARHYGVAHSNNATQIGNTGTSFANNDIFIANDAGTTGFTALGSATTYDGVAAWQGAVAQATANLEVDPAYGDAIADLESGSGSLDNAGAAVPGYITVDASCAARQNDIGSFNINACTTPVAGTISGTSPSCDNDATIILSLIGASSGLGISYQWNYGTSPGVYPNPLGTAGTQDFASLAPGTYYIVADVTCSAGPSTVTTPEFVLTINPNPSASANAGAACLGQILQLTGTTDFGTGYSWTGPNGFSSSLQNPTIDPVVAASGGTYVFTATENGCSTASSIIVSVVNPPSIISLTADPNPVCVGADAQLSAIAAAPGYTMGSGGSSFIDISGSGTAIAGVGDDTEHNITIPGGFTFNGVSYTDARVGANGVIVFGATAGEITLTNSALPTGSVAAGNIFVAPWWDDIDNDAGGGQIFLGQSGNLFIAQWNSWGRSAAVAGQVITFQVQFDQVTGQVFFVYSDVIFGGSQAAANDNGLNATVGIQWENSASGFIQYSFNQASLTDGQVISFTPNTPSYSWAPNTYLTADNIADPIAEAVAADITYTLTVTAGGCSTEGTLLVEANPAIAPTEAEITPDPAEFCTGSTVTLTATPLGGGGPYSFTWTDPNAVVYGPSALATIDADVAGLWSVSIDDGCGGTATANVSVTENPTPSASATASQACLGGTLDLDGTTDIGTSFSWTGPDSFTSTSEDPSLSPVVTAMAGTYTFTATLGNCTSDPATVVVTTDETPVISAVTATPNPVCTGNDAQLAVVVGGGTICTATSTNTTDEWITNVTFAGINNTSGSNTYTDYTAQVATVTQGASLPISVDVRNEGGSAFTETVRVYADWNQDGIFGTGESYDIGSQSVPNLTTLTYNGTINVPPSAAGGSTRLRVILRFSSYHPADGCGSFTFGEVEDYTVLVSNGSPAFTYLWTPNTFLSADDISNPVASTPSTTTVYSVEVTAANGCSATDNVTLTVNQTPDVDLNVVQDCVNEQYSISVQVNSTGSGPTIDLEYTVNGGSPVSVTGLGTGPQTPLGPFNQLDELVVTVIDPVGGCNSAPQPFLSGCPELVDCALEEVIVKSYCYGNDDTRGWLFQTADGLGTLTLQFIQGEMAPGDVIRGYSGIDNSGAPIDGGPGEGNLTGNFPSLTGVTGVSSGASLFIEVDSDGSGSCQDAGVTIPWQWQVQCTPGCVQPDAAITHTLDCTAQTFDLNVEVLSAGDGSTFTVDVAYTIGLNGTQQVIPGVFEFDIVTIPGISLGDTAYVYLLHADNPSCDRNMGFFTHGRDECPNDEPCSAWILPMNPDYSCTDVVAGNMTGATLTSGITGGCTGVLQDQWYRFTATATTHRVRLTGTTTGLSHSIYVGSPDCNTLTLVAGTACVAGATASNPANLTIGETYYVRVSRTTTGTNAYNVCVSAPPLIDVDATVLASPAAIACYGAAETVSVTVVNNSIYTLDLSVNPLTVNVNVTGAAVASLSGTLSSGTVAPAATIDVPMSTTLDMSATGTYTFNGSAVVVGDGNTANDAMTAATRTVAATVAVPQTCNFTGFTGSNLATVFPNFREGNGAAAPAGTTSAWTSSSALGQTTARINLFTTTRNEWIVGPKFAPVLGTVLQYKIAITDFASGAADPVGMQSTDDRVRVMISTDCGASWSQIGIHDASNTASITNSLVQQQIDLSSYAGQPVLVGFLAQDGPVDNTNDYDFHLDDINITNIAVCAGPPVAGTASSSVAGPVCAPAGTNLSLTGQSTDAGVTITWWSSAVSGGPYTTNLGSGTATAVSGLEATTYFVASVKCTATNDSTLSNEVSIQVTPRPVVSAGALDNDVCLGETISLTGTSDIGGTYAWTGPNGFSSTDQNPTIAGATLANGGTYSLVATQNGCPSAPSTTTVTVNPPPTINTVTSTPDPICIGGDAQLNADATGALPNVLISEVVLFRTGTGQTPTYPAVYSGADLAELVNASTVPADVSGWTVQAYANNGASASHTVTFPSGTVIPANGFAVVHFGSGTDDIPSLYFNSGGSSDTYFSGGPMGVVVKNGATVVDAVGAGTTNFTWNAASGVTAADWSGFASSPGGIAGSIRTSASDSNTGADWTASSAGTPQTIGTYNDYSNPNSSPIVSYLWSPATFLSSTSVSNPTANGVTTTTAYTVTITNAAGCESIGNVTVTANPSISGADISPSSPSFCTGGSVLLSASPIDGGAPFTYSWTDPNLVSTGFGAPSSISANLPGIWTVDIQDDCGGTASASINVTEFAIPVASASSNSPVCVGSPINLDGGSDVPGSTFAWTGPNGFSSTDEDPVIAGATLTMGGDYTVIASANGCSSDPATTSVSVNVTPTAPVTVPSVWSLCPGGSVDISASSTALSAVQFQGGAITIPAAPNTGGTGATGISDPYPSAIAVSGLPTSGVTVKRVFLNNLTHTFADDLDVLLQSPTGTYVVLMSDCGGVDEPANVNYEIRDDAASAFSDAGANPSGAYQCTNFGTGDTWFAPGPGVLTPPATLATFTGDMNGTWNLYIQDDAGGDVGSLGGWAIEFEYNNVTYTWSGAGLSTTTGPDVTATPGGTTTYTVTAENGGCTASTDVTVYIGTNTVNLEVTTDGAGSETSFEIVQVSSGAVIYAAGGTYPNNAVVTDMSCLPDGCYHLRVLDAGGDGIAGGGYILREADGAQRRIIDNSGNFSDGAVSEIANGLEFCLPLGDDRLIYTSTDKLDWRTTPCNAEYVVADDNPAVTAQYGVTNATSGYQMWWFDPNGGYSFRRYQSHSTNNGLPASATRACHFRINAWTGNQLQEGVLYNVKVRGRVNGTFLTWGQVSRFMLDNAAAQCPSTKLMDIPGNNFFSCGAMREIGTNHYVHAVPKRRMLASCSYQNANRYQFRFRILAEGFVLVKTSATGQYFVNTTGLECDKTYEVDVRVSFDNGATWCVNTGAGLNDPAWGDVCLLTTTCSSVQGGAQNMGGGSDAELSMYPNPNRGDQLFLSLSQVEDGVNTVSVDIYDGFGKRVSARTIAVQDGFINTVLDLNGELATGLYLVNITAGEKVYTERLVVQP